MPIDLTARARMRAAFAHQTLDCVPVSPDLSAMVPVHLAGRPFDEMFLDGQPHHGYASASVAQAYVDAVRYYGFDGWYIYGSLPEIVPEDRPRWRRTVTPMPGGQSLRETAETPYGALTRATHYPANDPPWDAVKPIKD